MTERKRLIHECALKKSKSFVSCFYEKPKTKFSRRLENEDDPYEDPDEDDPDEDEPEYPYFTIFYDRRKKRMASEKSYYRVSISEDEIEMLEFSLNFISDFIERIFDEEQVHKTFDRINESIANEQKGATKNRKIGF